MTEPGSAGVSPALASTQDETAWRSRGYLPHFDHPGLIQMIAFRLADALSAAVLSDLADDPKIGDDAERRRRLEARLDAGHGACHLRDARLAQLVERALMHFDGVRYCLLAWVVMPNHAHVLIETVKGYPMSEIVQSWKSFTAKRANELLERTGRFWQPDYFDRVIRDKRHLASALRYVHDNPVKAGLVDRPEAWPYSSAARSDADSRPM